jgi:hypothetical protein
VLPIFRTKEKPRGGSKGIFTLQLHLAIMILLASHGLALGGVSSGSGAGSAQLCSLGSQGVGQPGQIICRDAETGRMTQSVAVGNTVVPGGNCAGNLVRQGELALVTNQAQGALLLKVRDGLLRSPIALPTGEDSLSGALTDQGSYVLTAKHLVLG